MKHMNTFTIGSATPVANRSANVWRNSHSRSLNLFKRLFWTRAVAVLAVLMLVGVNSINAASYYLTAAGAGNAQVAANWNTVADGSGTAASNFTTSGDMFIIPTGLTTGMLNASLTINGSLNIQTGGTLTTNNNSLTFGGDFINSGTLTAGSSPIEITGASNQNIAGFTTTGLVSMTKTGGTATFTSNVNGNQLIVNGNGGTLNLGSGLTHSFLGTVGSITLTNGTLDGGTAILNANGLELDGGTFIAGGPSSGSTTYTYINGDVLLTGGTFLAGNKSGITEIRVTGTWTNNAGTFNAGISSVFLYGAAQTINGTASTTFYNLGITGSGLKTFTRVPIVSNILGMEGTSNPTVSAAPIYGSSATLEYFTTHTAGPEWITPFTATGGVTIDRETANDDPITLNEPKEFGVSVPLNIMAGAILNTTANNYSLTFGGNFVNDGTLTANASPIVITGIMPVQSIGGFTTLGSVSMTKTAGTATFTGSVNANAFNINGLGGTLNLGSASLLHTFTGDITLTSGTLDGGSSTLHANSSTTSAWTGTGSNFIPNASTVGFEGVDQTINTPTTFYNLTFTGGGTKTIGSNITVKKALTNVSPTSLNVVPTKGLTIDPATGTFTSTGTFTLQSNATGTATLLCNSAIDGVGNNNMQQALTFGTAGTPNFYRYWYVSSPVVAAESNVFQNTADTNPLTKFQVWSFSELAQPSPYILVTNTSPISLNAGSGYVARMATDRTATFTGTFNTGNVMIPLTNTNDPTYGGYNLIGNPYPSYLDWDKVVASLPTGVLPTIWYRSYDATNQKMVFDTYNGASNLSLTPSGHVASNLIPPTQAFWVYTAGSETLTLTNSMRSLMDVTGNYLRTASVNANKIIRLNVSNGKNADEAIVGFNDNASDSFDAYDSPKMTNDDANIPEIFTYAGSKQVAINGLKPFDTAKELALGFRTGTAGTFTINAKEILNFEEGTTVILKDKLTNISQNLTINPEYTFTSAVVNNADRFSVVISKIATDVSTAPSDQNFEVEAKNDGVVNVYLRNMKTEGTIISICDIQGQKIVRTYATGEITSISTQLHSGIYLIVVTGNEFKGVKKITINH